MLKIAKKTPNDKSSQLEEDNYEIDLDNQPAESEEDGKKDGNGRIARVISNMILAQSEKSSLRFYSMSSQIQKDRQSYYKILEKCQKSTSDITLWLEWFLLCLKRAITSSDHILKAVLNKSSFWQRNINYEFNTRQKLIINKLLDNFEGNLTTSKWAKICKCSQDTALRDIIDLVSKKIL